MSRPARAWPRSGSSTGLPARVARRREVVLGVLFDGVGAAATGTFAALLERAQGLQPRVRLAQFVGAHIERLLEGGALVALGVDGFVELATESGMDGQAARPRQGADRAPAIVAMVLAIQFERTQCAGRGGASLLGAGAASGGQVAIA